MMIRIVSVILVGFFSFMPIVAQQQGDNPTGVADVKHSVPLNDIILDDFSNFSNRLLPYTQASREDLLKAYNRLRPFCHEDTSDCLAPSYETATEGGQWLSADSLVIGYIDEQEHPYAFPFEILTFHGIVNDILAEQPLLIAYCPPCNSAVIYSRNLNGRTLGFGNIDAYYQNTILLHDTQTESLWLLAAGRSILGPLTDEQLQPLPSVVTTWGRWQQDHPETLVLARYNNYVDYTQNLFEGYETRLNTGWSTFPMSDQVRDDHRLKLAEPVLVVDIGTEAVAYPLALLGSAATTDVVGGERIVVLSLEDGPSGAAYRAQLEDETSLDLAFDPQTKNWREMTTGSIVDLSGSIISGPLEGQHLIPLSSRYMFWFAATATIPNVQVYQPTS
jgi:Protein of unknown function (DUF3179)